MSVNLNVLEDILKISKISYVQLVMKNVKLVTVVLLKIVFLVKLLHSRVIPVYSTYMMRELKNVTKPVLLTLTKLLVKTFVLVVEKTVLFAIKLTKVIVLLVTIKLFWFYHNVTFLVQKVTTWVKLQLDLTTKESVSLVVMDVLNVLMNVFVLHAILINSLTLTIQVCVLLIVLCYLLIFLLLTICIS